MTEWVDWELDTTTLKLGHRDRFAPEASAKRMSKLKKKRIREAARKAAIIPGRGPRQPWRIPTTQPGGQRH